MQPSYWIFGTRLEITADETETGQQYDIITGTMQPGVEVPLHRHTRYSESVCVMTGELTVYTPGKTTVVKAGDHIFIPIGTPHAIVASGTGETSAITVAAPGGFAKLIRTSGVISQDGQMPREMNDMELFIAASIEAGDELLGPPGSRP